jgi:hypothetical protein
VLTAPAGAGAGQGTLTRFTRRGCQTTLHVFPLAKQSSSGGTLIVSLGMFPVRRRYSNHG